MSRLTHEDFFTSLTSLLNTTTQTARGSVYLTQKPLPTNTDTTSPAILIRATDGNTQSANSKSDPKLKKSDTRKKTKLSTVVNEEDLEAFYARYAEVCKAGMTGLKKRDRKKGKAKKAGASGAGAGGGKVSKA
ncbi:hypothetical protein PHISCL_09308 [Aspergillus sclerotialis]|uniref:Signal recognition particle subunit SRP14 n=1 Tax=Aspergillus sclerotialis TaxID=2070753 RepID=A0A3A2Z6P8_9EURO|nr:hypothetical protein PHISCL_09308 [Aspergillus sclerotialis]